MRGLVLAIVGLVLVSASPAQNPSPQSGKISQKQPPATCAVSGQVVAAADGTPLKSSRVVLIQEDATSNPEAFSATTDSDGRFEISKVTPGRYGFFATHAGYIGQQYQARGMSGGTPLTLVAGQMVDRVLFRLVRTAVVTERIVDESGEPLAKIVVATLRKLSPEETEDWGASATKDQWVTASTALTDDRGEYRIFDLKPGEYYVRAAASDSVGIGDDEGLNWIIRANLGNRYAPVYYPGVIQLDQAQSVVVAAGEEMRAEFVIRKVKTVQIAGHVIAADGRAASGASVMLYSPEGIDSGGELSTSTGAKGEFTIKGVPPENYVLTAQRQDEDRRRFAHQKLDVGNENIESISLAFSEGTTIRGRVAAIGASMPERVQIQLVPTRERDVPSSGFARCKPDGSFQMPGVSDGDYALRVYGMEEGWYVRSARLGGEDVLQKGLQVEKGSVSGTLDIGLSSAGAQLEGTVTDHDKPAGGAVIWATPEPETPYNRMHSKETATDQNGHFTFRTLPPGKYRVTAKLPSTSSEAPATASKPKVVTLAEHDHQTLQLTLATPQSE